MSQYVGLPTSNFIPLGSLQGSEDELILEAILQTTGVLRFPSKFVQKHREYITINNSVLETRLLPEAKPFT